MGKSKRFWMFVALGLATVGSKANADLLTQWNIVTIGDLYANGPDAQGGVRVGGNLTTGGTFDVGSHYGGPDKTSLIVGGQVTPTSRVQIHNGGGRVGSADNGYVHVNGGGSLKTNDTTVAATIANDAAELKGYSAAFAAMTSTLTPGNYVTLPDPKGSVGPAKFVVNETENGNAVFNIAAKDLFGNPKVEHMQVTLSLAAGISFAQGASVIINVSGTEIDFGRGLNFIGDFDKAKGHVIWNFYEATSIDFAKTKFKGSILAPFAKIYNTETIDGSVFVKQFGSSVGNGMLAQTHTPLYDGYVPTAVAHAPEPSSLVVAGAATIAAAVWSARRRRTAA